MLSPTSLLVHVLKSIGRYSDVGRGAVAHPGKQRDRIPVVPEIGSPNHFKTYFEVKPEPKGGKAIFCSL